VASGSRYRRWIGNATRRPGWHVRSFSGGSGTESARRRRPHHVKKQRAPASSPDASSPSHIEALRRAGGFPLVRKPDMSAKDVKFSAMSAEAITEYRAYSRASMMRDTRSARRTETSSGQELWRATHHTKTASPSPGNRTHRQSSRIWARGAARGCFTYP